MAECESIYYTQDFAEEQSLVARLIHQLRAEDTDDTYSVLKSARESMRSSGDLRLKHTLPSVAFCGLQLIPEIKAREDAGEKVEATCKQASTLSLSTFRSKIAWSLMLCEISKYAVILLSMHLL